MDETPVVGAAAPVQSRQNARGLAGWLKFFGIVTIIGGALNALSVIGILWAWFPIWMGIVLVQAGSRSGEYAANGDEPALAGLLARLKTYYLVSGIVTIVAAGIMLLGGILLAVMTMVGLVSLPELIESIQSGGFGS
jgi:hypothetical protein